MYGDAFSTLAYLSHQKLPIHPARGCALYKIRFSVQIAGLILLVAMIGAISLTMRKRVGVRRQSIADQINRRPEDVMEIVTISSSEAKKKPRAAADSVDLE